MSMAIAARAKSEKKVRSSGFPSSRAWAALPPDNPSHIAGGREPRKNNQTTGSHKTADGFVSLAGSQTNSATRRTNQSARARVGGIAR